MPRHGLRVLVRTVGLTRLPKVWEPRGVQLPAWPATGAGCWLGEAGRGRPGGRGLAQEGIRGLRASPRRQQGARADGSARRVDTGWPVAL